MSLCQDRFLYQRFRSIASLVRTLEFFFAVVFLSGSISRSSAYLPAAVDLCRFFARRLSLSVLGVSHHHFIFLLGNLIAVTLFVKSGRSGLSDAASDGDDEEYLIGQFVDPICDVAAEEADLDEKRGIPAEIEVSSETEADRKTESSGEEDLSNEEFQRKVEAFIEQQQRFLREECLSVMKRHSRCSV